MATIRKRGKRWQVQIRRRHAPNLSRSFVLKSDAEAWSRQMEVDADRRLLKYDPRILDTTTLSDLVVRYRDEISSQKRDAEIEIGRLNRFLLRPLCRQSLSSIGTSDFAHVRDDRLNVVSASTVNRELAPLQHMYEIARSEWGYPIEVNPLKLVRRPPNNPPRQRRLHPGEEEALFLAAEGSRKRYIGPCITIAIETGMRRGEILNMEQNHFSDGLSSLRIPITKTNTPRTIPVSKRAQRACESLLELDFRRDSRLVPAARNAFRLCWERTVKRAGIDDLHFHDLRHEAISRFFERGLTLPEVAALSGHRDFRMLARYAHVKPISIDLSRQKILSCICCS